VCPDLGEQSARVVPFCVGGRISLKPVTSRSLRPEACHASRTNGLHEASSLMVDKITSVHRSRLAMRVSQLADEDLIGLGRAIVVFLGLAGA
jgi:mRNA-degrading endonuclease toxin of MazEF toxin-antitoxin module